MFSNFISYINKGRLAFFGLNIILSFSILIMPLSPGLYGFNFFQGNEDGNIIQSSNYKTPQSKIIENCQLMRHCALRFNGVNQWVELDQFPGFDTAAFTLENWFSWDGTGTLGLAGDLTDGIPFITIGGDQGSGTDMNADLFFGIQFSTGKLMAVFKEAPSTSNSLSPYHYIFGNTTIKHGSWHHAAITYNGQTLKLFLDGNLDASLTFATPILPNLTNSHYAYLAAALTSNGEGLGFFNGDLDEVRMWETARSQLDIQSAINLEDVTDPNLMGQWSMNEGAGTDVNNKSGNGNRGQAVNDPIWTDGAPFNLLTTLSVEPENGDNNTTTLDATINLAPNPPTLISPYNGATDVYTSPTLSTSVSDPESGNLTVTFYGRIFTTQRPDFTLVTLPDTQKYTNLNNGIFGLQTQWIVDQQSAQNIVFVNHLGDMVNWWSDRSQWNIASAAMGTLDSAGIPYGIGPGNCDEDNLGVPPSANTFFNSYFPESRFAGRPYYGGAYNGNNSNSYQLFSASGLDFIVINLQYNLSYSPDLSLAILTWANDLLHTYSNRRAIVITHYLLNTSNNFSTDGNQVYTSLKGNPNLFLMMGGHYDTEGMRQNPGSDGHTIYSLRSDYQTRANGGNGWLRLLRFSPDANKIYVTTYSPYLNQYETDTDSQFSLDYNMNGDSSNFQVIGTTIVPSGSTASIDWPTLLPQTPYEWYVTINDGTTTTTGQHWYFTTAVEGGNQPPVIMEGTSTSVSMSEDGAPTAFSLTLHATDVNVEDTLTWNISTPPLHGIADASGTGFSRVITYTPTDNYNGTDSFGVQVSDGNGGTDTIYVNATIEPVNDAPACMDVLLATVKNTPGDVSPSCTDVDNGDILTYSIVGAATNGTASVVSENLHYIPNLDYTGPDSFTYKANDTYMDSNTATVTVTVNAPSNTAPNQPSLIAPTNGATGISFSPILSVNVSDLDSDMLTVELYGRPKFVSGDPFSLVFLPDTQSYTIPNNQPLGATIFNSQTNWIVANKTTRNIIFVDHLGDITDNGTNDTDDSEWIIADAAFDLLDAGNVAYNVSAGNHDLSGGSARFNTWFGISRFIGKSYYGGYYVPIGKNYYNYNLFSASGLDFILINLNCPMQPPLPEALTWADGLLASYPNRRGIVVCHDLLTRNYIVNEEGQAIYDFSVPGQAIYDALKDNPNLFLMLGAHLTQEGFRSDTYNGNIVYSIRSDYSAQPNGGNGWLRILEFQPANNKIQVYTYSPYLNSSMTNSVNEFSLPYSMSSNWQLIETVTAVTSSSTVNVHWSALNPSTEYEWYVVVKDGTHSTTGPIWNFTTGNEITAPVVTSQPASQTINAGQTASFSAAASGSPTPTVQWQVSSDGSSWSDISGATSLTYSFTAQSTDNGKQYRAIFTNPAGSATTYAALLIVNNDLIFKDGFNSCDATAWTGGAVNPSRLAFNIASGRDSTCGMAVTIASSTPAYVVDLSANEETRFRARFYYNPNTLKMPNNTPPAIFIAYNTSAQATIVVQIRYLGGALQLRSGLLSDTNTWSYTSWSTISKAWHIVEFDWIASTSSSANNGSLTLWLDGTQKGSISTIDNDQQKVDKVALGVVSGLASKMSGTCLFDNYESRRLTYIDQ